MELYSLDRQFQKQAPIDKFISAIWTERYATAGDITLVTEPSQVLIDLLAEGTFVALAGSKEVMLIENALVENGQLKVTGNTLDLFLNQRLMNAFQMTAGTRNYYSHGISRTPEDWMRAAVANFLVAGGSGANWDLGFDGARQVIPNLSVDYSTAVSTGLFIDYLFEFGPMYDQFVKLCQTYSTGFSLYLDSATPSGYSLKFKAYFGLDHTSDQNTNKLIRFSPDLESLSGISRVSSIASLKNVAYVYPPDNLVHPGEGSTDPAMPATPGIAFANPESEESIGFDRRVIMNVATDITLDQINRDAGVLMSVLTQRAKDLLANNTYTKVVDGEVVPQSQYIYGVDYGLGALIELDDGDGTIQNARITEFIRSQDSNGERAYPTVSVV